MACKHCGSDGHKSHEHKHGGKRDGKHDGKKMEKK